MVLPCVCLDGRFPRVPVSLIGVHNCFLYHHFDALFLFLLPTQNELLHLLPLFEELLTRNQVEYICTRQTPTSARADELITA